MPTQKTNPAALAALVLCALLSPAPAQPEIVGSPFTDSRDGRTYHAVEIGGKTWMADNLNYKTGKSWCYDKNEHNCKKYGRLYDWNTAKSACPKGWRLPSREEWNSLTSAAGGKEIAGKKLKSKVDWEGKNGNGTDELGFSGLPGGYRDDVTGGSFQFVGKDGRFWSASSHGSGGSAYYNYRVCYYCDYVEEYHLDKKYGFSVRCVKDE